VAFVLILDVKIANRVFTSREDAGFQRIQRRTPIRGRAEVQARVEGAFIVA
jgi:hypothetical protein